MTQIKATKLTDTYTLSNGLKIPVLGFGTFEAADGQEAYQSTLWALKHGYRHIDTAAAYGNEESVGRAIKDSGVAREDLFVTTKLWNTEHNYDKAKVALASSLKKLQLDYLDLYLIHWPNPQSVREEFGEDGWKSNNADIWKYFEEAYDAGLVKSIGVSNFLIKHLEELKKTAKILPMVNQIRLTPSDQQEELVKYDNENNILNEAYSPLERNGFNNNEAVLNIGTKYNKTVQQVLLRWSLEKGFLPLPKSTHEQYIQSNTDVFDFELSQEDTALLDGLSGTAGAHNDPDTATF
ncbi:MAG: aldo/keto reductase [Lactobacillaceae bacterium]|jgi:diketogulonate reductase-like aldo/keto reductase|nr:aldo/keto reductase [Lactobacillaceae bacterium]